MELLLQAAETEDLQLIMLKVRKEGIIPLAIVNHEHRVVLHITKHLLLVLKAAEALAHTVVRVLVHTVVVLLGVMVVVTVVAIQVAAAVVEAIQVAVVRLHLVAAPVVAHPVEAEDHIHPVEDVNYFN